jgi:hypothetical protein
MLFMDGHVQVEPEWETLEDIAGDPLNPQQNAHGRGIRIDGLDQRM